MIKIEDINSQGNGVGRQDNIAIFVPYTAIGETVEIEILKDNKSYKIASAVSILEKSPNRVDVTCPYYQKCGSCNLLHINYQEQLRVKQNIVKSAIERIGKINCEIQPIVASDSNLFYRNKAAFPVSKSNVGYYAHGSHNIVDINSCMLVDPKIIEILISLKDFAIKHSNIIKHIVIKVTKAESMVTLVVSSNKFNYNKELIGILKPLNVTSINININKNPNLIMSNKTINIYGKEKISYEILGNNFLISPLSFTQINTSQAQKLYSFVIDLADLKDKTVVDAYCGIGTISLALAKKAKFVYGIEIVEDAIKDAKQAQKNNNIENVSFHCAKCEEFIPSMLKNGQNIDLICLDPPRGGLDKKVIDAIANHNINEIIYVSCSPQTLARDLKLFCEYGYTISSITPFDMFPNTAHVETVVQLFRKTPDAHVDLKIDMDELDLTKATYQ